MVWQWHHKKTKKSNTWNRGVLLLNWLYKFLWNSTILYTLNNTLQLIMHKYPTQYWYCHGIISKYLLIEAYIHHATTLYMPRVSAVIVLKPWNCGLLLIYVIKLWAQMVRDRDKGKRTCMKSKQFLWSGF